MDYNVKAAEHNLNEKTVVDMCRFYQLGKFVNRKETLESGIFSQEDLDALEVLDIIMSVNDIEVLRELSKSFSEHESVINALRYHELSEKVPNQYSQEFVDGLISPEKAEQMIQQGMPGIRMREEDGIKIITLEGMDFYAYVTNPYLNNGLDVDNHKAENLAQNWRELENGIPYVSGCAIDQYGVGSTIKPESNIGLGFSSLAPSQIIAMGPSDLGMSHNTRQLEQSAQGNVEYNDLKELMTRKEEAAQKDSTHQYDETVTLRTNARLSQIKSGTYGGKIIPDYIYTLRSGFWKKRNRISKSIWN